MLLATSYNTGVYQFFLFLHILAAIVGFGSVVLNGVYAAQARQRGGREGLAIFQANAFVTMRIAEYAIYAVFVFGLITGHSFDKRRPAPADETRDAAGFDGARAHAGD